MKSEKGITLISLIVYITVMLIVITIIGTVTSYFYANVNDMYNESKDENGEYTLYMYLTKDLKNKEMIIETGDSEKITEEGTKTIKLTYEDDSKVLYTITDDGIYRNSVKIYNIEEDVDMIFKIQELPDEKIELQLLKDNSVFKSYIVNIVTDENSNTN